MIARWRWAVIATLIALSLGAGWLFFSDRADAAIQIEAPFSGTYSLTDLGSVPGVPTSYGGMTFKSDDANKLLIGGGANDSDGKLYAATVTRGAGNHITGFSGSAASFAAAEFNDGGVAYGPGNVLFYARWDNDEVGEIKPGSTTTDKVVDLDALGVTGSPGGLNFVPAGFSGAGQLKIVSFDDGTWYTATYSANGSGTYNITDVEQNTTLSGGPEGFTYVPPGSPLFPLNTMLQAEYDDGNIVTYQLDASGNPKPATRTAFITGLEGAEGAAIDPMTGDFLFSTFGGGDHLVVVQGFVPPPTASPTASPSHTPTPSLTSTSTTTPTPTATPVHSPTPTGTHAASRIQGDVTCDAQVDEADFEFLIEYAAGLNDGTKPDPCPDLGEAIPAGTTSHPWGDVNCDDGVNAIDALYVIAHTAGIELHQLQGCVAIGQVLT